MKKLLTISFVLALSMAWSQVELNDSGLQQCFTDNYPAFVINTTQLDTVQAKSYSGTVSCLGDEITNLEVLSYFESTKEISFSNVSANDLTPILDMNSLLRLKLWDSQIPTLPDLSSLSTLEVLKVEKSGLLEVPQIHSNLRTISFQDNLLEEMIISETYPELKILELNGNQLNKFEGLPNLPKLEILNLTENPLTELESFENNDSLKTLRLVDLPLESVLLGLSDKVKLEEVAFVGIDLTDLPDLPFDNLTEYLVARNNLTFEDLLPLLSVPGFPATTANYDNQNTQGEAQTIERLENESWTWTLDFDQTVNTNYYLWYKDGVKIDSTTEGELVLNDLNAGEAGVYTCEVKNTLMAGATLKVQATTLNIETTVTAEESSAFSPNGDGEYDTFYIDEEGTIQLVDERGRFVKELQGPAHWDGTDNDGNPLPFGYYILVVNGKPQSGITIVK